MGWNSIPAASSALATAPRKSISMPMTSPVDFISGPRYVSTPASLDIENTGAFTATSFCRFHNPPLYPISARVLPSIIFVASLTIGTPVTLERKGTVRLERGFTSRTYTVDSPPASGMACGLR